MTHEAQRAGIRWVAGSDSAKVSIHADKGDANRTRTVFAADGGCFYGFSKFQLSGRPLLSIGRSAAWIQRGISMVSVPKKTRRELFGVLVGATFGGALGLAPALIDQPVSVFFTLILAVFGGMLLGGVFRGELGWMTYGTMTGAVIAHWLWSNPKFNYAGAGIIPGALIGLLAGIIRDLFFPQARQTGPPTDGSPRLG